MESESERNQNMSRRDEGALSFYTTRSYLDTDVNLTSSRINIVGLITCSQLRNVAFAPICVQPCNETDYFNVHVCCFCADLP